MSIYTQFMSQPTISNVLTKSKVKANVNIPRTVDDVFFRYKRNELELTVSNKNNGITCIHNGELISSQLGRDVKLLIKMLKKQANTMVKFDKSTKIITIQGNWSLSQLDTFLENWIKEDILCCVCNNPETFYPKSNRRICRACGDKITV